MIETKRENAQVTEIKPKPLGLSYTVVYHMYSLSLQMVLILLTQHKESHFLRVVKLAVPM